MLARVFINRKRFKFFLLCSIRHHVGKINQFKNQFVALFTYDPTLFMDDDDAVAEDLYEEDDGNDEQMTEETK